MLIVSVAAVLSALASPAQTANSVESYFQFGKILALGKTSIEVQTFDERAQRFTRHSFVLSRETRADAVHLGDLVEVIYVPTASEWSLRRLILLGAGIPSAGPPAAGGMNGPSSSAARVPLGALPRAGAGTAPSRPTSVDLSAAPSGASVRPGTPVELGKTIEPKTPPVVAVPLGAAEAIAKVHPPGEKQVARDKPSEECNRSSVDWPAQPVRLAVLDFRYPTEREEAHDTGTTGGGSGTAVADLVFSRLEGLAGFAVSRADRQRLYRADFAGAARVGRLLGVDAVLAGTFAPVEEPHPSDEEFAPPKAYELRAGIVDTCTGQLLLRLSSAVCPGGIDPGPNPTVGGGGQPRIPCTRYSVTSTQAADPQATAEAYRKALDSLLSPLEHNGPPRGVEGSAGVVTATSASEVTIKLRQEMHLSMGDQVAIHTWGLTKDPSTYTLRDLQDEEIGRVTIKAIQGRNASGSYAGDIPPHAGDTADLISPQP